MIGEYLLTIGLLLLVSQHKKSAIEAVSVDSARHQAFADKLTSNLYDRENECSSTFGLSMAFSLIYPALTGIAVGEVRDALGYPSGSNQLQLVWNETSTRLVQTYQGQCQGVVRYNGECSQQVPTLKIANRIYYDDANTLLPGYESVVGSCAQQIDMELADSSSIVNKWVKDKTDGLIETIVPEHMPLSPCELVALNSIYLNASWAYPFQEDATNLDSFYKDASRNSETDANFMHGVLNLVSYSHTALDGYQVVGLPFTASTLSMLIVLPTEVDSKDVLSRDLLANLDHLTPTRVALSMPKFQFESEYEEDLKNALMQAGIVMPFRGESSLCGLFQDDGDCHLLAIDKVVQKTIIDVNECGVEAAAATAIMIFRRSAPRLTTPVLMTVDHPFQFFVYDKEENLVIFEGRLGKPEVSDTKPALRAKHSDDGFWSTNFGVNPVDPMMDNYSQPRSSSDGRSPSSRQRKERVCINLGRSIGRHTFLIPYRQFSWLRRGTNGADGAARGGCDPNEVRRLRTSLKRESKFCFNAASSRRRGEDRSILVRAPAAARGWLKRRGATEDQCDRTNMARNGAIEDDIHMELIE